MEKKKEFTIKKFLNEFEIYLGAVFFVVMTVLLFAQVVTRYVFGMAFTWTEELATILFVWMIYLGVAAAVRRRKHLKIDAFVETLPFKKKKILLIGSNVIFFVFCVYIMFPLMTMVNNFAGRNATSSILLIPKAISYGMLPVCFGLTAFRIIQEMIVLFHEKEADLGVSKPTLDIAALEREALANKKAKEGGMT